MLLEKSAEIAPHLQLGGGVFLTGVALPEDVTEAKSTLLEALSDEARNLGRTKGGGQFRCIPLLRSPWQAAGRTPTRDDTLLDGWTVVLTGTLLDLTPEGIQRLLPGSQIQRTGRVAALMIPQALAADDYLSQLIWLGDTTDGLVAIELTNVMNVSGFSLSFIDRSEGAIPFEFRAFSDVGGGAPCRVLFLE